MNTGSHWTAWRQAYKDFRYGTANASPAVMNAITRPQYDALKNDRSFTVIHFHPVTGQRLGTYSGLDMVTAMRVAMNKQFRARVLVLRDVAQADMVLSKYSDYETRYGSATPWLELPRRS